ncbi:T9SS type A sorting domain-containing protein, partial [Seonamhaeicola maritimus]|uniref:T9SS type A sorting domain-containing protein n=1 Tax=Seonamhaeicola maritimus TaxID=2591822 RepID=UPI0014788D2F
AEFDPAPAEEITCEELDSFVAGSLSYSNGDSGACDISGSVQGIADSFEGNCGSFDVNYSYTDACGRTITATQVVTVVDNVAPIITCPEPSKICNIDFPATLDATWTDNCLAGGTITATPTNIRYREDMCAELADYVFTISDGCGNETIKTCTITREFDKIGECETAFAMDDEGANCFIDDGFRRWGWTNYLECEGDYTMPLYAGAAHCDTGKGTNVGDVIVNYSNGMVTVTYDIEEPGYVMSEAHVYVGCDPYPKNNGVNTVAPGQYPYNPSNLGYVRNYSVKVTDVSGPIYVIAHAVTCQVLCMCSSMSEILSDNEDGMISFEGGIMCYSSDGDSHGDSCDNCPDIANEDQADADGDGMGDVCDVCPLDADNDIDGDGYCADVDACPNDANKTEPGDCGCGVEEGTCDDTLVATKTVDFKAYPVPFDQEVTLKYSFDYDTNVKIEVFDMKGALIRSSEVSNYSKDSVGSTKLDLSGADDQMFFVRLTTKEGTVIKKIVSSSPQ